MNNVDAQIPFFSRIRSRLTLIFLMVSIIPIILITVVVLRQVDTQSRNQVFNQLESVSLLKSQQIETWLKSGSDLLQIMSTSPQISLALQTPALIPQANIQLNNVVDASSSIEELFLYSPEGVILAASNEVLTGRVVNRQPYFAQSLLDDEYLQPPFFDVSTGELALIATIRIRDGSGDVVAIAAVRYNTDELGNIMIERIGLGETGETYLISQENNYFLTGSRYEDYRLNRAYTSEGIEQALTGQNGQGIYENYQREGVTVFGVYRWIPALESGLLTEISLDEALAPLSAAQNTIIFISAGLLGTVLVIGYIVTTRFVKPITQITQVTSAIAQGDFNQRAQVNQKDEIGLLASAFNNMTQTIQNRTEQLRLARDEAQASQRIAQENSRLKSEFLATMSHELRTPMNAIEGFTSIMLKRMAGVEYNEKAERYLHKVQSNSQRLLGLINDFLDLSRIESGRMQLAHLPISPKEMAHKWRESLGVLAENKGLEFHLMVDPELPETIYGDEEALSKIAINLIGNAAKFTKEGSVSLDLRKQDHNMVVEVKDTGIGIPPHARDFIFEEFRQVDQSSKREFGGTGLGLAIVQKLAREMGGSVSLESDVGVGSTFTVLVPINTENQHEQEMKHATNP